jgi:hypothetical protein
MRCFFVKDDQPTLKRLICENLCNPWLINNTYTKTVEFKRVKKSAQSAKSAREKIDTNQFISPQITRMTQMFMYQEIRNKIF